MNIILRFLVRNIKEKKLRSILVICAISVATALFFATSALKANIQMEMSKIISKNSGDADISISAQHGSPSWLLRTNMLNEIKPRLDWFIGVFDDISAVFMTDGEDINFSLTAMTVDDMKHIYSLSFIQPLADDDFYGRKIIIAGNFAGQQGLVRGDIIKMTINGRQERLQVAAIAAARGPFRDDGFGNMAIVPKSLVAKAYNQLGKVNHIYIKAAEGENLPELIRDISELYPRYAVREAVNRQEVRRFASQVTTPYNVMLVLIIVTSIYIIFTSFQVITRERLPVIGTFRSIGATRRATSWLFYFESFLYGIIGGIIGLVLGILILYIMGYSTAKSTFGMKTYTMYFTFSHILNSFLLAVFISFVSSVIPIRALRKIPARDIILNTIQHKKSSGRLKIITGIIFIAAGIAIPPFMPKSLSMTVDVICILSVIFGLIFFSPVIINAGTILSAGILSSLFGNIGMLATKNIRKNRKMQNNIALLTIGISSLIMISTISQSIKIEVLQVYSRADYQAMAWIWPMDRQLESRISALDGINRSLGSYRVWQTQIKGRTDKILNIQGINTRKFLDFWRYPISQAALDQLDTGRYMIAGYGLKAQFHLQKGDDLELLLNDVYKKYKIIGFFNTMWMNGRTGLVSDKYLKLDASLDRYGELLIKSDISQEETVRLLKKSFSRVRPWAETVNNLQKNDIESNAQLMSMLTGFSILSMIIGTIGIINNFLLAFLDRKRNLAIFKSQGMSKRQMIKMIFVESLAEGTIGAAIGVCGGLLMLTIIPNLLLSMDLFLPLHYSLLLFLVYAAVAVLITMAASISPALKAAKLNTIQALKYE